MTLARPFVKLEGTGNDFVLLEAAHYVDVDFSAIAPTWCDRRFGIGADGILVATRGPVLRYRMFNPDGSEAEACGNGLRCFTVWAAGEGWLEDGVGIVETRVGPRRVQTAPGGANVEMGFATRPSPVTFEGRSGTVVSVGNPHLVFEVDDVHAIDLLNEGPRWENDPHFPHRTNVHFVSKELEVRHWERGAGATLACGSGAVAVAVTLLNGEPGELDLKLPGGAVTVRVLESGMTHLIGPAREVFRGTSFL